MKLLFVSMNARTIEDNEGNIYLNSHMNRRTIKRYSDICGELHMIFRDSGVRCSKKDAQNKYEPFPHDLTKLSICFNPFNPRKNLVRLKKYKELERIFEEKVCWADRVIIASAVGVYSELAIKYCKKYKKRYMLLVGGFAFETDWNHGLDGKIVAHKRENKCKKNLLEAPYALYVTCEALQKRYPCNGITIGCSDVEITEINSTILDNRIKKITSGNEILSLGTAANVDNKQKGHRYVIKAIAMLKQKGYRFEYHLLGSGSGQDLIKYAEKCGVVDQVFLDGSKPHEEVYKWLDNIDIYIQPSFTEGLCRAVVEAMSRACPVVCTNVGGNVELCSKEFLVKKGDAICIANALEKLVTMQERIEQAQLSYKKSHEYNSEILNRRRTEFLLEFMK